MKKLTFFIMVERLTLVLFSYKLILRCYIHKRFLAGHEKSEVCRSVHSSSFLMVMVNITKKCCKSDVYIIFFISGLFMKYYGPVCYVLYRIYEPLDRCEKIFMKMSNISNLTTQVRRI